MEKLPMKLLLIEDDQNECNKFKILSKTRNDINFVAITDSDIEGMKFLKMYNPEGIILDLELNKGKGNGNRIYIFRRTKKVKLKNKT